MDVSVKPKRQTKVAKQKKDQTKVRVEKSKELVEAYKKYFIAPTTTPDTFPIFDMTGGGGVSYSSHT